MDVFKTQEFINNTKKLDNTLQIKIAKQILKILNNPNIGKPLKYSLKGEKEIYIKPFRLYFKVAGDTLVLLGFEHKDEQSKRGK